MGKFRVASLFCGCGGTDIGLIGGFDFNGRTYSSNNMDIVYANDIDDNACTLFEENFGVRPDNRDIREVEVFRVSHFRLLHRIPNDWELKMIGESFFSRCVAF